MRRVRAVLVWTGTTKPNVYARANRPRRVAFRAYQVLTQPVDKLVQVLGLEVPVAPLVSLAGIKADGVLLHWKPPDQRTSVLKYVIRINGIDSMCVHPWHATTT